MKKSKFSVVLLAMFLAGMVIVPPVSAHMADSNQQINSDYVVEHSIQIDSNKTELTKEEFNSYVKNMKLEYGSKNTRGLRSLSYPTISNLNYQTAWTEHLDSGPSGSSGSSDCALVLYKATGNDLQGKAHYFYYFWTSAKPKTGFNLKNFWSKLQLTNSNSRLISYDPGSTLFANGQLVTVSDSISYGGLGHSISKSFMINQDKVQPKDCSVGYGGKFGVEWIGNYGDIQDIAGIMHVDIPASQSISGTWTNNLYAFL